MKAGPAAPDVLKHLADSLRDQSQRYRKQLKRCQKHFSEAAVHKSRVETRRLLATVELLCAFFPERKLKKARRALKVHLNSFDKLRDTQVQLVYVEHLLPSNPAAKKFRAWSKNREKRFVSESRKAVKAIKTRRLEKRIAGFRSELEALRESTKPDRAFSMAQGAIRLAFARVAQLCRHVRAEDTETIHRTRIAFKRFRYMVEASSPLLAAVTEQHRQAMRGYQSMMGDIQDVEVLLQALDKFIKHGNDDPYTQRLRIEFTRRREQLVRVYLNAAGKLQQFWPLQPVVGIVTITRKVKA